MEGKPAWLHIFSDGIPGELLLVLTLLIWAIFAMILFSNAKSRLNIWCFWQAICQGGFFLSVTKYAHTHRITIAIWQLFPIGSHVQNVGQCLVGRALMRKGGRLDKICAIQIRRRRANRRAK